MINRPRLLVRFSPAPTIAIGTRTTPSLLQSQAMKAERISPSDCLTVALRLEDTHGQDAALLAAATAAAQRRLLAVLLGPAAEEVPTLATLDLVARCIDPCVATKPTLDVVPLLPSLHAVDSRHLNSLHTGSNNDKNVIATEEQLSAAISLLQQNGVAGTAEHQVEAARPPLQLSSTPASTGGLTHARVIGEWPANRSLQFPVVACGGTFDRLHAGHRLLLAATAIVTTDKVFVGVTSDKLLANKKNADLLESYDVRETAAVNYIKSVNPHIGVTAGPLSDPKVPPLCATDERFQAIVVSEETISGAEQINGVRQSLGFSPLVIVVVGLLSQGGGAVKLSSTDLRALEAGGARVPVQRR